MERLVSTTHGSEGEFFKLNEKPTYSKEELSEIEEIVKLQLEKQFSILDWYPITIEKITGNYALKLTYRRSLKSVINLLLSQPICSKTIVCCTR
jgi:hypothetical protein